MFSPCAFRPRLLLLALALLVLAAHGCGSRLSAAHLQPRPWQEGASQTTLSKFLLFEFTTMQAGDDFQVKGRAIPVKENLPAWVDGVSEFTVLAYLCDEHGQVLAHEARRYERLRLSPSGFPFDFRLRPGERPSKGYFVSFGYAGMFTASVPPRGGGNPADESFFFASEKAALTH